jgi:hypothetical protein
MSVIQIKIAYKVVKILLSDKENMRRLLLLTL